MQDEMVSALARLVKQEIQRALQKTDTCDLASLDWLQKSTLVLLKAVCQAAVDAWTESLLSVAQELARTCPCCGRRRKWKWRKHRHLKLSVLGLDFELPEPYVECGHCRAPGVSIMKLLTGLSAGDSSTELKLLCVRRGALDTYGRASREMQAHHGQDIERTKIRRISLEMEQEAVDFNQRRRTGALLADLAIKGEPVLVEEADGGSARTAVLVACQEGDEGYGKTTIKRGIPRKKKQMQGREMITMDVRAPGEMVPRALEVLVPALAPAGERERRMQGMAARAGRGTNTQMRGLGDMGSSLAQAFDSAFPEPLHFWSADWKHVTDYVAAVEPTVEGLDFENWSKRMKNAIWNREESLVAHIVNDAYLCIKLPLLEDMDKHPLHKLQGYLRNNWAHFRFKQMAQEGLPFVSARAECQVRERTRKRFGGPATWSEGNLEPKATVLAIIDEGSWDEFAAHVRDKRTDSFRQAFRQRLETAVREGRLTGPATDMEYQQERTRLAA